MTLPCTWDRVRRYDTRLPGMRDMSYCRDSAKIGHAITRLPNKDIRQLKGGTATKVRTVISKSRGGQLHSHPFQRSSSGPREY